MLMNSNEVWTAIHGMVFGFIFLLGFSGALYAVYSIKAEWLTAGVLLFISHAFEKMMLKGICGEFNAIVEVQFLEHGADVITDRLFAQVQ